MPRNICLRVLPPESDSDAEETKTAAPAASSSSDSCAIPGNFHPDKRTYGVRVDPEVVKGVHVMYEKGDTMRMIGWNMNRSTSWVSHIINNYYADSGMPVKVSKVGRPKKKNSPEDAEILEYFRLNRQAGLLAASKALGISRSTVRRRLEANFVHRTKPKGDQPGEWIVGAPKRDRPNWALWKREQLRENPAFFDRTIFSDEAWFSLVNGGAEVSSLDEEGRINQDFSSASGCLVWGALSRQGAVALVILDSVLDTEEKYIRLLTDTLIPYMDVHGRDLTFQQDCYHIHTGRDVTKFFYNEGINVHVWPAKSPHLHLMNGIWNMMKESLIAQYPKNLAELREMVVSSWRNICTSQNCAALLGSLSRRLDAVIYTSEAQDAEASD